MAIKIMTATPQKVLNAFKKAIDDGHVKTWSYDADGDFTHTPTQWKNAAWLHPTIAAGKSLTLTTIPPKSKKITWSVYGVYHGRFIESIIEHCHDLFTNAYATAKPTADDTI